MYLKKCILSILLILITSSIALAQNHQFNYIKRGDIYYAVVETPDREYIVIGTRDLITRSLEIIKFYGGARNMQMLVEMKNGRQKWIEGRVMDNGRNRTFYSEQSARQFVRRLAE